MAINLNDDSRGSPLAKRGQVKCFNSNIRVGNRGEAARGAISRARINSKASGRSSERASAV